MLPPHAAGHERAAMLTRLRALFSRGASRAGPSRSARARLGFDAMPAVVYAVGDVHGRLDLLVALERMIVDDARHLPGEKWIVLLGDIVDRGPQSAQVLDHLTRRAPAGFNRMCLAGNHEIMMLDALEGRYPMSSWMEFGGLETLMSYGISPEVLRHTRPSSKAFRHLIESHIPEEHLDYLSKLPVAIELPSFTMVHAGMRPGVSLGNHGDDDLTLGPPMPTDADHLYDKPVVHGHRIVEAPLLRPRELNVDTGAYLTGRLTAARLVITGEVVFLTTSTDAMEASNRTDLRASHTR